MIEIVNNVKEEYYKKFEMKAKSERKAFVFGQSANVAKENVSDVIESAAVNKEEIVNEVETAVEENTNFSAE